MTTVMRGRRTAGRPIGPIAAAMAALVVVAVIVLGLLSWHAGGPQPTGSVVEPIAVPGTGTGSTK